MQVRVEQGKEPDHMVALFGGKMVIHKGGKASGFKNKAAEDTYDTYAAPHYPRHLGRVLLTSTSTSCGTLRRILRCHRCVWQQRNAGVEALHFHHDDLRQAARLRLRMYARRARRHCHRPTISRASTRSCDAGRTGTTTTRGETMRAIHAPRRRD